MRRPELGTWGAVAVLVVLASFVRWYAPIFQRGLALGDGSSCTPKPGVVNIGVSVSKYPHVWRHVADATAGRNTLSDGRTVVDNGLRWTRILVKNDRHESERRAAAFRASGVKTRKGFDRDEYPPAEGRSTDLADIRLVPSGENRSQGASMGNRLRILCNGQEYRMVKR